MTPAPEVKSAADKIAEVLAGLSGKGALDESRVIELIQEHAPKGEFRDRIIVREVKGEPGPDRTLPDAPRHEVFADILAAVEAGVNVMLVGPAGCGKTHICEQVAEALGFSFHFSGAVASEYKLTGFVDAQGRPVRTSFREAYEKGGVFLWDEMDASAPQAMLAFNAGLANGQQDFPDATVKRHENFRAIASANTYGRGADRQYVGRNQMDAASLDRFAVIEMDYDEKMERALFGDNDWTGYVQKVRAAVRKLNVRHVVSMRAIKDGAALLARGMSRDKVKAMVVYKGLDAATVAKIEAETGA